jgi:hypothetical protein
MNKIFVEFYIAKVYINVVFRRRRQKPRRCRDLRSPPPHTTRPAAAVIFDHRRRLRQDPPPLQNRCRRRLKTRRRRRIPAAAAEHLSPPPKTRRRRSNPAAAAATDPLPPPPKTRNFLRLRLYGYNDHDNHGYIMIGYLDIDITNTVYSNLRTPVNSVRIITCVHATHAVTVGGKRGETGKAPEVPTH